MNVAAPSGSGYGAPSAAFAKPESPAGRSVCTLLGKKSARRFAFLVSDEARSPLSGHASSGMTYFGLEIFASAATFCHQRWLPSISEARSASFCSKYSVFALLIAVVHWLRICLYCVQVWSDLERRAALKSLLFLVHKRRKFGDHPAFLFGVTTDCTSGHKRTNGFGAQIIPDSQTTSMFVVPWIAANRGARLRAPSMPDQSA